MNGQTLSGGAAPVFVLTAAPLSAMSLRKKVKFDAMNRQPGYG